MCRIWQMLWRSGVGKWRVRSDCLGGDRRSVSLYGCTQGSLRFNTKGEFITTLHLSCETLSYVISKIYSVASPVCSNISYRWRPRLFFLDYHLLKNGLTYLRWDGGETSLILITEWQCSPKRKKCLRSTTCLTYSDVNWLDVIIHCVTEDHLQNHMIFKKKLSLKD